MVKNLNFQAPIYPYKKASFYKQILSALKNPSFIKPGFFIFLLTYLKLLERTFLTVSVLTGKRL